MENNIQAEQSVLGYILTNPDSIYRIPFLRAEHFYQTLHQDIFAEILELTEDSTEINPIILGDKMADSMIFKDMGGTKYLLEISGQSSALLGIRDMAELVFTIARRREFERHIVDVNEMFKEKPNFDVTKEINALQDKFASFSINPEVEEIYTGTQLTKRIYDKIVKMHEQEADVSYADKTGIEIFDKSLGGGLYPQTMTAIGGRTGHGKTMFACTVSYNLSRLGTKHMYVAAEMGSERIYHRILARRMGKNALQFKYRKSQDGPFIKELIKANGEKDDNCLFKNAPGIDLSELKRMIITNTRRYGLKGVIVDYIQLIKGQGFKESRVDHLENVVQTLEAIKNQENIWILMLAQIKKDGTFRGGDPIENACDDAYEIKKVNLNGKDREGAWFRHIKAREGIAKDIGEEDSPCFEISKIGPHFEQINYGGKIEI